MPSLKKYTAGITEKRLKNKRFIKTEEAILKVFFEEDCFADVMKITKKAGVSRAAFYRHHRTIRAILMDYERYVLARYYRMVYKMLRKNGVTMRVLYTRLLIFVIQNREIYSLIMKYENKKTIEKMVKKLQPKAINFMKLPGNSEKILDVYTNEVVGLIWRWMEKGMKSSEIEQIVNDVMFLTKTARLRLKPLQDRV